MAAIALPTTPGVVAATVRLLDYGGTQRPILGGPDTRVSRLGSRHAMDVQLPPMDATTAMSWIQRLKRGKTDKVRMRVPQPGFTPGTSAGTDFVNASAAAGATSLQIVTSLNYPFKEGQLFSVVKDGISYLYSINADVTAHAVSGVATVGVCPMLRTSLANTHQVELLSPIIEGWPEGDEMAWDLDAAAHYGLAFTIVEAE